MVSNPSPISTVFLDIGGVLLTNGWDHHMRQKAAEKFNLDYEELNERHHLTFDTYEEGKLSLDEYLTRVIFHKQRPFPRDEFRDFMFRQSEPYPDMIEMIRDLKARYHLQVGAISNEGRELTVHRIQEFSLAEFMDFLSPLALSITANRMRIFIASPWIFPRLNRSIRFTSKTARCSWM